MNSIRTYIHSMKRLQERSARDQGGESTGKVLDLGRTQYSCLRCIEVVIGENKWSAWSSCYIENRHKKTKHKLRYDTGSDFIRSYVFARTGDCIKWEKLVVLFVIFVKTVSQG